MGDLVAHVNAEPVLEALVPRVLVHEHDVRVGGDEPDVLHRAKGREMGDGHDIELVVRIRDVEIALQGLEHLARERLGVRRAASFSFGREHADRRLFFPEAPCVEHVERPDRERHEVRGDRLGLGEVMFDVALVLALGHELGVRDDDVALGRADGDLPRVLERGLVEAGERAPRLGALELGEEVFVAALLFEEHAAIFLLADLPRILHHELRRAGDGLCDDEAQALHRVFVFGAWDDARLLFGPARFEGGFAHVERHRVEPHHT